MVILKVIKKHGFILSLENFTLKKPCGWMEAWNWSLFAVKTVKNTSNTLRVKHVILTMGLKGFNLDLTISKFDFHWDIKEKITKCF